MLLFMRLSESTLMPVNVFKRLPRETVIEDIGVRSPSQLGGLTAEAIFPEDFLSHPNF